MPARLHWTPEQRSAYDQCCKQWGSLLIPTEDWERIKAIQTNRGGIAMKLSLPLDIWIPRKTMEDKLIHLNQNWYRNAHHMTNAKAKEIFKAHVQAALTEACFSKPVMPGKYSLRYTIFPASNRAIDVMNFGSVIDKFTCDALVELGIFKDDNHKILPEFHFSFGAVDKENPRCELEISEVR